MEPHHITILSAMRDGKAYHVDILADDTGMTRTRVHGGLVKLLYAGLVIPTGQTKRTEDSLEWRLSAAGRRLVETMAKRFGTA